MKLPLQQGPDDIRYSERYLSLAVCGSGNGCRIFGCRQASTAGQVWLQFVHGNFAPSSGGSFFYLKRAFLGL